MKGQAVQNHQRKDARPDPPVELGVPIRILGILVVVGSVVALLFSINR